MLQLLLGADLLSIGALLFAAMVVASEVGYRLGHRRQPEAGEAGRNAVGFATGGMLGLLAFLLSILLSLAQGGFDARRNLVRDEGNAIGTVWLLAGIFEDREGGTIRALLPDYTRARIAFIMGDGGAAGIEAALARTSTLQHEMWAAVTALARREANPVTVTLIASLSNMFDLSLTVRQAMGSAVPTHLAQLMLACSLLAIGAMGFHFGLGGARNLVVTALLLMMWTEAMLLIIDLNRARSGAIITDSAPLVWTLQGFGPTASR